MDPLPRTEILHNIESYLSGHGISLASLVMDTLRDPESSLTRDLAPRVTDVLAALLDARGISFASLVIDALQDPGLSLAEDLVSRVTDVLDTLHPHLDDGVIRELGEFFASLISPELTKLGKDSSWRLPATNLSAEQLRGFSMKKMSQRIASEAPGFSSFLHSICAGKTVPDEVVADNGKDKTPGTRQGIDRARLLEIV